MNIETGKKLKVTVGDVHVFLSRVWTSSNVSINVDIPLEGSPSSRHLQGRYASYAVEKTAQKLYRANDFGAFNPKMTKDGIEEVAVDVDVDADGSSKHVRLRLTAKPHKAGSVLGGFLAKMQFDPPASDLNSPMLSSFPKDDKILTGIAKSFYASIKSCTIAIIGGKKTSVKSTFPEKFNGKYAKCLAKIALGKTADPEAGIVNKEAHHFKVKVTNPGASVLVAHVSSHFSSIWVSGGGIIAGGEPEVGKYAKRFTTNAIGSESRMAMILHWYERAAEKDPLGGKSLTNALAIGGIQCGLPIESMAELAGSNATAASILKAVSSSSMS